MMRFMKSIVVLFVALVASVAQAEWATGEIRRVDVDNKRLTIKHGEIKSIDMPPMTMVFYVNDPALLKGLQVNDKIEFQANAEGKKYFVTAIRPNSAPR